MKISVKLLLIFCIVNCNILHGQIFRDSATFGVASPAGKKIYIKQLFIGDTNTAKTSGGIAYMSNGLYSANGTYYQLMGGTNYLSADSSLFATKGTIQVISGKKYFNTVVADSVQSNNNYTVLYSDTKIAGTTAGDTSANFTAFLNTAEARETKVRIVYLHRRGIKYIKAYYQIRGASSLQVGTTIGVYTIAGVLVSSASTYTTDLSSYGNSSNSLDVSTLSSNTLYELRFSGVGVDPGDVPDIKYLSIIATSN